MTPAAGHLRSPVYDVYLSEERCMHSIWLRRALADGEKAGLSEDVDEDAGSSQLQLELWASLSRSKEMRVAKQTLATEQAKAAAKEQLAQAMKDVSYAAHLNLCLCQQPAFLCHAACWSNVNQGHHTSTSSSDSRSCIWVWKWRGFESFQLYWAMGHGSMSCVRCLELSFPKELQGLDAVLVDPASWCES